MTTLSCLSYYLERDALGDLAPPSVDVSGVVSGPQEGQASVELFDVLASPYGTPDSTCSEKVSSEDSSAADPATYAHTQTPFSVRLNDTTVASVRASPQLPTSFSSPYIPPPKPAPLITSQSLTSLPTQQSLTLLPPNSLLRVPRAPTPLPTTRRRKFSSTETMYLRNNLHTPDVRQVLRSLSKVLSLKIKHTQAHTNPPEYLPFEEHYYTPLAMLDKYPAIDPYGLIHDFLSRIFHHRKLSAECGVVAVVYIDRLLADPQLEVTAANWCLVVFVALLLAHKVWAEYAVWNEDFVKVFPKGKWLTVDVVRKIEREFLKRINFNLNVKPSVYSRYYFELRTFAKLDNVDYCPMDKQTLMELEVKRRCVSRRNRSVSTDSGVENQGKGTVSFDQLMAVRKEIVLSIVY